MHLTSLFLYVPRLSGKVKASFTHADYQTDVIYKLITYPHSSCCTISENQLTYSITGGNIGNAFEVVPDLGEIKVRGILDYEKGPRVSEMGLSVTLTVCMLITLKVCILRIRRFALIHHNIVQVFKLTFM